MNEFWLRWKARIGSLKPLAILVLILAGFFFCFAASDLITALRNPSEPENVPVSDLVDGTVGASRYVKVSGFAIYDAMYTREEDGKTTETYYALIDDSGTYLLVVKADTPTIYGRMDKDVVLTGMTRSTASELRGLIEGDLADIREAGLETNPKIYLVENAEPPSALVMLAVSLGTGFICLLCVVTFFFPGTVFAPLPLDAIVSADPNRGRPALKATGRFQRLKQIKPTIEIGRGTQKLNKSVANLVPLAERKLLIYVHRIVRTKRYGVTISKRESDWGVFLTSDNVIEIVPGKQYGWKDMYALRCRYTDEKGKERTLLLGFDLPEQQADAIGILRGLGFVVAAGMAM